MNLYRIRYTQFFEGVESTHSQIIFAKDIDVAGNKWQNMRLPNQQTESITLIDRDDLNLRALCQNTILAALAESRNHHD